jgi:hypothetical protein
LYGPHGAITFAAMQHRWSSKRRHIAATTEPKLHKKRGAAITSLLYRIKR